MSYDSKIASARDIIERHNSNVTENPVIFDQFLEKLRTMGGSSDEALKAVSWEDLENCGAPRIIARRLAHLFRQDSDDNGGASAYISPKKAQMLTHKELIERYNPKDVNNTVAKRLNELSEKKAFVVFDDSGKILVEPSSRLLEDIMRGLPSVETTFVEGRPLPVYKIGDRPDTYADENPLYPGRALRSEEVCDQTGRSWKGVFTDLRQLLYLAVKNTKELEIKSAADAGDILDKVVSQNCVLHSLRSRYPQASKKFDELSKVGRLPLLKIKLGKSSVEETNNPFGAAESRIF
jgi:hypothetical protein